MQTQIKQDKGIGGITPSYENPGEEAVCERCRDTGWLSRLLPTGNDIVPCECQREAMEEYRTQRRYATMGIPEVRRMKTLEAIDTSVHPRVGIALAAAQAFVGGGTPMSPQATLGDGAPAFLVLTGPKGCGKTHLARGVVMELVKQGWEGKYMTSSDVLASLYMAQKVDAGEVFVELRRLQDLPLLAIDDLGTETYTGWSIGHMEDLLNKRLDSMAATVVTSNLAPSALREMSGRLYSRFEDKRECNWVDMQGVSDYRRR